MEAKEILDQVAALMAALDPDMGYVVLLDYGEVTTMGANIPTAEATEWMRKVSRARPSLTVERPLPRPS